MMNRFDYRQKTFEQHNIIYNNGNGGSRKIGNTFQAWSLSQDTKQNKGEKQRKHITNKTFLQCLNLEEISLF